MDNSTTVETFEELAAAMGIKPRDLVDRMRKSDSLRTMAPLPEHCDVRVSRRVNQEGETVGLSPEEAKWWRQEIATWRKA